MVFPVLVFPVFVFKVLVFLSILCDWRGAGWRKVYDVFYSFLYVLKSWEWVVVVMDVKSGMATMAMAKNQPNLGIVGHFAMPTKPLLLRAWGGGCIWIIA